MENIYWGTLAISLSIFLIYCKYWPRKAILIGLIFTTFSLGALPWHLLPGDGIAFLTQMGFIYLSLIYYLIRCKKEKNAHIKLSNTYIIMLVAFTLIVLGYVIISHYQGYGISKGIWFFVKAVVPLIALSMLAPIDRKDICIIFFTVLAGSVLMMQSIFVFGDLHSERVIISQKMNPISIDRAIGLGATLLLISVLVDDKSGIIKNLLSLTAFSILLFSMQFTGSRGPLFAIIFTVIGTMLFFRRGIYNRVKMLLRISIVIAIFVVVINNIDLGMPEYASFNRITEYITTLGDNSSDRARTTMYTTAWKGFIESCGIGIGTGGFGGLYGTSGAEYPHNIILEVASEQGVFGLIVLLATLIIAFFKLVSVNRQGGLDTYGKAFFSLWFAALFNSFVSSDLANNHTLWIIGGMAWLIQENNLREEIR